MGSNGSTMPKPNRSMNTVRKMTNKLPRCGVLPGDESFNVLSAYCWYW